MRAALIRTLIDLARENERIFLLVGDVGYSLVEPFAQEFPDRFVNIGIAEQNMIGIASGLALCDKIVFTYSIANFPTLRCLEQIRNDVCYHNANVKVVSSGGGLAYGSLGATHHVTEDLAIMRALPNMTVVAPGDPVEAALATQAIAEWAGPCYLRLAKTGDPIAHQATPDFQIGKATKLREGRDVTLIATGGMLYNTIQAAEQLAQQGFQSRVLSMHTIKPLDTEAVLSAAAETSIIVTIEEHSMIGGLGGAVAELLAELCDSHIKFKRMGLNDSFCSQVGSQEYLRKTYSLSIEGVVSTVICLLES
ncbi:MAG: transketolase [Dehalococcoidia bacterium]|nr:MAG: transketolase [Dehalococcoidia bacterium]